MLVFVFESMDGSHLKATPFRRKFPLALSAFAGAGIMEYMSEADAVKGNMASKKEIKCCFMTVKIQILQKNLARIKKSFIFAVLFREEGQKLIENIGKKVQASTEKTIIESVNFFFLEFRRQESS